MLRTNSFKENDAFIGYQKDTPASVIFHATNMLRKACELSASSNLNSIPLHKEWKSIMVQSGLDLHYQYSPQEEDTTTWTTAVCVFYVTVLS